jgi:hypothetical protein
MKLRKGCGCPVAILALVNLAYVIASIVSLATGSVKMGGALLILSVGAANLLVCVIVALAAFRGEKLGMSEAPDAFSEGYDDAGVTVGHVEASEGDEQE